MRKRRFRRLDDRNGTGQRERDGRDQNREWEDLAEADRKVRKDQYRSTGNELDKRNKNQLDCECKYCGTESEREENEPDAIQQLFEAE